MKTKLIPALVLAGVVSFLAGCEHTIQGMKQDIHEGTASNPPPQTKTVVVKKTKVIYPNQTSQQLPSSPPPLETPQ